MKCLIPLLLICSIFAGISTPAHAHGEIVYSARYYNPRGVSGNSHFHIYTIDPDGSHRRQLTFGKSDDDSPRWSPDGQWIAFLRGNDDSLNECSVCVVDREGHHTRRIVTGDFNSNLDWESPNSVAVDVTDSQNIEYEKIYSTSGRLISKTSFTDSDDSVYSPNRKYGYEPPTNMRVQGEVVDIASKRIIAHPQYDYDTVVWLSNSLFGGIRQPQKDTKAQQVIIYDVCDLSGIPIKSLMIRDTGPSSEENDAAFENGYQISKIETYSPISGALTVWQSFHVTGTGQYWGISLLDARSKTLRFGALSSFIAWSPDHTVFCGSPGNWTSAYPKRIDGRWRRVWTAPLEIIDIREHSVKKIQSGLIWVGDADWLGGSRD